jgi:hypothetical protein
MVKHTERDDNTRSVRDDRVDTKDNTIGAERRD